MSNSHIVFVINLLQDVSVVRPLALLSAAEFEAKLLFLVSSAFRSRDKTGLWSTELNRLAVSLDAEVATYNSPYAGCRILGGKQGLLIAGSESNVPAHSHVHDLFRVAPSGFLKITLQHGFECIGFLQNQEQTAAFGGNVRFAADIVCGWAAPEHLRSLAPSQRSKLYVSGPQALLVQPQGDPASETRGGLICENLHSIRFGVATSRRMSFMDDFNAFADAFADEGGRVTLRPHPGGQYVLRNNVSLGANVDIENRPIYQVDLRDFQFGISAPSTVLLDMVFAGVPVAVWRDADGVLDVSNYAGLHTVSSVEEWRAFAQAASTAPQTMLAVQAEFLEGLGMPLDPAEVRRRFTKLLAAGNAPIIASVAPTRRIMLIANDTIPTLDIFFMRPLRKMRRLGEVQVSCLTEKYLAEYFEQPHDHAARDWVLARIAEFRPTEIIFCRYSGPHTEAILGFADERGIATIYHLDDDLLNIPIEFGQAKYRFHNDPGRLESVTRGLKGAKLVYASNVPLLQRMQHLTGRQDAMVAGTISSSAEVRRMPAYRSFRRIGYMGFDHAHDLETILPALVDFLHQNEDVCFELLGTIPKPAELDQFGERISTIAPVRNYNEFQDRFAEIDWDIGICPLADTSFNAVKGDVKWVEYTSAGMAVVATRGTIYDVCCADGRGWLASTQAEWFEAFDTLCNDVDVRYRQIERAQHWLREQYSLVAMERQLLSVLDAADSLPRSVDPICETVVML